MPLCLIEILSFTYLLQSINDSYTAASICYSAGCITAAHTLLENMDKTVDPCDDFYLYACGGFEKRVSLQFYIK